ncbi:MAG TPA: hypothetical protein PKY82_06140 [Pyrinomonadaceae bacterium]|nr:hypothetical protein [Pyrinomonadaceae bacterium]
MNNTKLLQKIEVPVEFNKKTAFLMEIIDESYLDMGFKPETIVLVDNSKKFSTKRPIAFSIGDERFFGLPEIIIEDLFQLTHLGPEKLFSKNEINVVGQVRGYFKYDDGEARMIFESL